MWANAAAVAAAATSDYRIDKFATQTKKTTKNSMIRLQQRQLQKTQKHKHLLCCVAAVVSDGAVSSECASCCIISSLCIIVMIISSSIDTFAHPNLRHPPNRLKERQIRTQLQQRSSLERLSNPFWVPHTLQRLVCKGRINGQVARVDYAFNSIPVLLLLDILLAPQSPLIYDMYLLHSYDEVNVFGT